MSYLPSSKSSLTTSPSSNKVSWSSSSLSSSFKPFSDSLNQEQVWNVKQTFSVKRPKIYYWQLLIVPFSTCFLSSHLFLLKKKENSNTRKLRKKKFRSLGENSNSRPSESSSSDALPTDARVKSTFCWSRLMWYLACKEGRTKKSLQ